MVQWQTYARRLAVVYFPSRSFVEWHRQRHTWGSQVEASWWKEAGANLLFRLRAQDYFRFIKSDWILIESIIGDHMWLRWYAKFTGKFTGQLLPPEVWTKRRYGLTNR